MADPGERLHLKTCQIIKRTHTAVCAAQAAPRMHTLACIRNYKQRIIIYSCGVTPELAAFYFTG